MPPTASKKKSKKVLKCRKINRKTELEQNWIGLKEWRKLRRGGTTGLEYYCKGGLLPKTCAKNFQGYWRVLYPDCEEELRKNAKTNLDIPPIDTGPLFKKIIKEKNSKLQGFDVEDSDDEVIDEEEPEIDEKTAAALEAYEKQTENKRSKEHYAAKNEQLKYEKAAGILIEKEFVSKNLNLIAKNIRNKFLTFPARVSGELTVLDNPKDIEIFLSKEINFFLEELSSEVEQFRNDI